MSSLSTTRQTYYEKQWTHTSCCNTPCATTLLLKYHLPLGLTFGLLLGYVVPVLGTTYSNIIPTNDWIKMSNINVFVIFFLSGLKLQTDQIKKALTSWKAVLYGVFLILVVTPLSSFALVNLPFQTTELAFGLAIFFLGKSCY